ncbi:MAG: glycosyltransferase family 2 protein [Gemmataceae bacterium]|nr:glycosyltransferase family 2 protein [Gemmataceae bacterium]
MPEKATRRRRRGNPYAGLIHLLNRRYHEQWQRAELLQNDVNNLTNSKFARAAEWLRRLCRWLIPHPAERPKFFLEQAEVYRAQEYPVPDARVSVVIPFRDRHELLANCLRSLKRSTFPSVELVLVDNGSTDPRTDRLLARVRRRPDVRAVTCSGPFNFSRLCNAGAHAATGDHLVFLNNDVEVLTPDWLERMLALGADPAVGVVGATLLYPDRTIQHAGLLPRSDGMWVHAHRGLPATHPGDAGELRETRSVPAVTAACLLVRRNLFERVGGFDENLPLTFNDVDFCRRVRAIGRKVLVTPRARLIHYEGLSRGFAVDAPGG